MLTLYNKRRDLQLFRWSSYVGGDKYRYPPKTTLSSQTLSYSVQEERGDESTGGLTYQEVQRNSGEVSYLVPNPAESPASYNLRRALAAYVNIPALIVDAYSKSVSVGVARTLGAVADIAQDVDLRGTSWANFVESIARWACVYGEIAVVVDAPDTDDPTLHPYCSIVHPTAWAWTRTDKYGRLEEFAYTTSAIEPDDQANEWTAQVQVWTREGWQLIEYSVPQGGTLLPTNQGKLLASGPLPEAFAGQLPVTIVYSNRDDSTMAPQGISLVADACDIARTIYNRQSYSDDICRKAGFPTLAIPAGDTGGQLAESVRIAIGPDKALGYSSATGSPSWIQPSAEWVKEIREQNVHDFQTALRQAGIDGAGQTGANSSGEALRLRSRDFESAAASIASRLQAAELEILLRLNALLGGDPADIVVSYPNRFVLPDVTAEFQRALSLLKDSPVEIGETAKKAATVQLIAAALSLDPATEEKISAEIEGVLSEDKQLFNARRSSELKELEPVPPPNESTIDVAPSGKAPEDKVQQTALNGAQVTSLVDIVVKAASRQLPVDAAKEIILMAFTDADVGQVERLLAPIRRGFTPAVEGEPTNGDRRTEEKQQEIRQPEKPKDTAQGGGSGET